LPLLKSFGVIGPRGIAPLLSGLKGQLVSSSTWACKFTRNRRCSRFTLCRPHSAREPDLGIEPSVSFVPRMRHAIAACQAIESWLRESNSPSALYKRAATHIAALPAHSHGSTFLLTYRRNVETMKRLLQTIGFCACPFRLYCTSSFLKRRKRLKFYSSLRFRLDEVDGDRIRTYSLPQAKWVFCH
jgi:hypothetical protein